jgi:DNA-nicking Smr family endonuclease
MARRKLSEAERELLAQAMRAVTPIRRRRSKGAAPPASTPSKAAKSVEQQSVSIAGPTPEVAVKPAPPNRPHRGTTKLQAIDRRTDQKLKRGQIKIDATLDLHGLSQERAHVRLNSFLARAALEGHRTVLVITGKGRTRAAADGQDRVRERGVLREAVPRWIEQTPLRDLVWGVRAAGSRHGGDGALYVLLKRKKVE